MRNLTTAELKFVSGGGPPPPPQEVVIVGVGGSAFNAGVIAQVGAVVVPVIPGTTNANTSIATGGNGVVTCD